MRMKVFCKKRIALQIALLLLAAGAIGGSLWLAAGSDRENVYLLYIGLNDKDSYEQIVSMEEARKTVNEVCLQYVDGYTVWEAQGAWADETGTITEENTLICLFQEVEEESLRAVMDELLSALNQNAILVEKREVSNHYYYGEGWEGVRRLDRWNLQVCLLE